MAVFKSFQDAKAYIERREVAETVKYVERCRKDQFGKGGQFILPKNKSYYEQH